MNSKTLMETGFLEWFPLKTLTHSNLPADQGIVVVIADEELSEKQESDILYIGRTKKPVKKILGGFLAGYGGKNNKKINKMLFDEGYIEKACIGWMKADKPRIMQEELLMKFKEEHKDVPAWNAKKKLNVKLKETPAFRRKQASAYKKKPASSEGAVETKPRAASSRKSKATHARVPEKTEMPKKEETSAEAPAAAKSPDTEMAP